MSAGSVPSIEGPSRFSPSAVTQWQQSRRKSVSNACERCRRRKIRCDGDTPCATCSRFSLACVRSQKSKESIQSEHQVALENRIHQLEAQLAAHMNAPMHGMESISQSLIGGQAAFDWQSPPQLTLDTNFSTPFNPDTDIDMASFSATSIPSIAITKCEPTPNDTSPSSPVPDFWDGTTRASSPEMLPTSAPQFATSVVPPTGGKAFSPPITPHVAPSWEFLAQESSGHLKPNTTHPKSTSRRSSVSSFSLDNEDASISPFPDFESQIEMPRLPRQGIFAPRVDSPTAMSSGPNFTDRSRAITSAPFPSRFEAETLTGVFLNHIAAFESKPYAITPSIFRQIFDTVYPDPNRGPAFDTSVSVGMARFHVFFAMTIGMKIRIQGTAESNSLLERCYELAMQQTSSATFWQEIGGVEAIQLLSIFSLLGRESNFEPKPLQQSWSW
ncbi:uncharacterized protein BDR25DRAFT_340965 [Lindgomyces ingoldianus]|uniref:Uncharacterized protein n=1 Tax=Lindgomyces ingoldianus TaxID=673940 RepID=A0ACB6R479_9PLEO|nr:uncharacterized protein BDR25DRAFT_340965 [Lindgomyces ingoldianus]KAF2473633.1 hypothetical protein BDR25DRAFT_340965 [Lindgomyces ingoldianus]